MEEGSALSCLLQQYSQQPRYEINPSAHQQMNGKTKPGIYTQQNMIHPEKSMKSCHVWQRNWNWRSLISQAQKHKYTVFSLIYGS